jgi:hypothetical protein
MSATVAKVRSEVAYGVGQQSDAAVHHCGHWRWYGCRVKLEWLDEAFLSLLGWVYKMLLAYLFFSYLSNFLYVIYDIS